MKYAVTHACGHTVGVDLSGPGTERDRKRRWLASRPCTACLATETGARADAQAEGRDLPPLVGSEKQVEWATRCRYHALLLLDRVLAEAERKPDCLPLPLEGMLPGEEPPRLGELIHRLYETDSARFWIDHGKDAHQADRRIVTDGIESNRTATAIAAGLLLAAAGMDTGVDLDIHRVQGVLRPGPAAMRRRVSGVTLDAHVERATATIRDALKGKQRPYVAVSGGKDSAVVMALVLAVRPDATLLWSDDELEYPETVALMERLKAERGEQLVTALGWAQHAGWFTPWTDHPFWRDPLPGTLTAGMDADDWMASRGHDVTFLGTRAGESKVRTRWLEANGPTYRVTRGTGLRCCPIWDWPTDYVYRYLEREGIALNPVYDRLAERGMGVELERRRVGPLPLVPRDVLVNGWPDLYGRLVARYGPRWD